MQGADFSSSTLQRVQKWLKLSLLIKAGWLLLDCICLSIPLSHMLF